MHQARSISVLLAVTTAASLAACEHKSKSSEQTKAAPATKPPPAAGSAVAKPATPPAGTAAYGSGSAAGSAMAGSAMATPPPAAMPPTEGMAPPAGDGEVRPPVAADLEVYLKNIKGKGRLLAEIETTMGTFTCELHEKDRPITVANFVGLATGQKPWLNPKTNQVERGKPYYDGVTFHRVIENFMIQGGDPLGVGRGGPGYKFVDEFGGSYTNGPGSLAMANAGPTTNGSQFFINEVDNSRLDPKHTVFGQCEPLDLVKQVTRVPKGPGDKPLTPVVMNKVTIKRGK